MTWVVPLALGGLAVLVMAVFTMLSARRRHLTMVAPTQAVGPRILVHDINDDRCTGCDACVAVCPTNVLDLVANKSRVLRFEDCIQCEACMFACPTEALVMFPEGGVPPPLKIPEIDENFQTAVPGQYLIGEVAGKPLVKNAANLGRSVIEHILKGGLRAGALGAGETTVDVAIVGSGPGGLSAALSCIQRGLSYVVLEKEQEIASTISRYPKGKLVMAEPYDTLNLSLLPVFDSAKEQLIPIWRELLDRVGLKIKQGESVESIARDGAGVFDIRTTVATYRAQRVVLSIGTRGKPRTLQVQGENLPKVYSLLEDPDEWRGRSVLVVGGGDSACEAALALADAGAKVIISYRGKGFNRAAPKNKNAIEAYAAEGRIKSKLGSQILAFDPESVTMALSDGTQKKYPNDGAFVLIGADPPVQWLEKMGVRFVERPHQHQMGKSDDIVRRMLPRALECPEDAARAAAQVLGGSIGVAPADEVALPLPMAAPMSGPRKWLRSATSIFSNRNNTNPDMQPVRVGPPAIPEGGKGQRQKRFDAPVPLSEFAKRSKTHGGSEAGSGRAHTHMGDGRRDQLTAGERTRILRMLRDEGGRLADEESQVSISVAPPRGEFDFEEGGVTGALPAPRPDLPAKPAVVVGLAQAQASKGRSKRPSAMPPPAPSPQARRPGSPPPAGPPPLPQRARNDGRPSQPSQQPRRAVPAPFGDEPTRQVDDGIMNALRAHEQEAPQPRQKAPTFLPTAAGKPPGKPVPPPRSKHFEESVDPRELDSTVAFDEQDAAGRTGFDELQSQLDKFLPTAPATELNKFLPMAPATELNTTDLHTSDIEDHSDEESTRMANVDGMTAMERARQSPHVEDRTRAVNIRHDKSISDIDWDLD